MSKDPLFTVFDSTELERDLALIDRVKGKFNLASDKDVAEWLKVSKSVISEIRGYAKAVECGKADGRTPPRSLTALQRLRAFDRLGYAWARDALMTAFPDAVKEDLMMIDNERSQSNFRATQEINAGDDGLPDAEPGIAR